MMTSALESKVTGSEHEAHSWGEKVPKIVDGPELTDGHRKQCLDTKQR